MDHTKYSNKERRNVARVPKSFEDVRRTWITDLESTDIDKFIDAQFELHRFAEDTRSRMTLDSSLYVEPSLRPLRRRLENHLDIALAAICQQVAFRKSNIESYNPHKTDKQVANAYVNLARGIERQVWNFKPNSLCSPHLSFSEDESVQERAIANIRIALSADRYSRREMLDALMSTGVIQSMSWTSLLEETALLCVPRVKSSSANLFRHCDKNGSLIHLVSLCYGLKRYCANTRFRASGFAANATENVVQWKNMS